MTGTVHVLFTHKSVPVIFESPSMFMYFVFSHINLYNMETVLEVREEEWYICHRQKPKLDIVVSGHKSWEI
jgi:hypothetical protein